MIYGSICSGIEAATCAWHSLDWKPAFFSEIEPFPRAVLAHHYPDTPLHGDFTTITTDDYGTIDLLVGGTPCQSFSIAGLRKGMADDRGNLALEYIKLAARKRPRWLVWENVPGVFSSTGGADFRSFLEGLTGRKLTTPAEGWENSGIIEGILDAYSVAWRVLDAQYFGVAQRRRRVFVVGYLGDWRRAAAVLLERAGLCGHPAPSRQAGQKPAPCLAARTKGGGGLGTDFDLDGGLVIGGDVSHTLSARKHSAHGVDQDTYIPEVTHALRGEGFEASEDGTGRGTPLVPVGLSPTLPMSHANGQGGAQFEGPHPTANIRAASGGSSRSYVADMAVRRLTPRECERLQGFPDDYTLIPVRGKPSADGPRYKALGNSMAVPVMHWIGKRIKMVDDLFPPA